MMGCRWLKVDEHFSLSTEILDHPFCEGYFYKYRSVQDSTGAEGADENLYDAALQNSMGAGENQSVVYEEEAKTVHVAMRGVGTKEG
jgi:hypothetical protein